MDERITVRNMAYLRVIAGSIEVLAALLMIRMGTVSTALRINGILALIGPLIMATVTAVGLAGIAATIQPLKLILIGIGVGLILAATR